MFSKDSRAHLGAPAETDEKRRCALPPLLPNIERIDDDPETRRLWKRFQMVSTLPEKDRRAVIRLVNSLVSLSAKQRSLRAAS